LFVVAVVLVGARDSKEAHDIIIVTLNTLSLCFLLDLSTGLTLEGAAASSFRGPVEHHCGGGGA